MNGPWARGPLSWMTRATSPLPVPVSPLQQHGRDYRMADRVEAGQVSDLSAQPLDRRRLAEETVKGIGRGRRAGARHGHLRSWAWPRDDGWPKSAADNGRNRPKMAAASSHILSPATSAMPHWCQVPGDETAVACLLPMAGLTR